MRRILLGVASAVALLSPAVANAETGGFIDVSAGQLNIDDDDLDVLSVGGSAAADLSGNWRAQFDVSINRYSEGGANFTLTDAAAHAYYEADTWSAGAVVTNTDLGFASIWSLGAEGQMTFGQIVVEGEAGIGTLEVFDENVDTTNLALDATFYATENFSIGAGASSIDLDEVLGTITTLGAEAEYQFSGTSNSVFLTYANTDYDDVDQESDTWRIGFRHAFGSDTLQGRRQSGPRWLPLDTTFFQFIA